MNAGILYEALLVTGTFLLVLPPSYQAPRSRQQNCGVFEWWDVNVNDCAPCGELCDNSKITRTQAECQNKCSDYLQAQNCTDNQYYDEIVRSCSSCEELCTYTDVTGTLEDCQNKCKAYLAKHPPPNVHSQDDSIKADANSGKAQESTDHPSSSKTSVAAIVAPVFGVAVIAAGIAVFVWRKLRQRGDDGQGIYQLANSPLKMPIQVTKPEDPGVPAFC